MNCTTCHEYIDQLVFEDDSQKRREVESHVAICPACADYLDENSPVEMMIHRLKVSEPLLSDPEALTDDILTAIEKPALKDQVKIKPRFSKSKTLFILQRLLAAASVALIVVFGFEQYSILQKQRALESRLSLDSLARKQAPFVRSEAVIGSKAALVSDGFIVQLLTRNNIRPITNLVKNENRSRSGSSYFKGKIPGFNLKQIPFSGN